jgi:hypothetical protein
MLTDKEAALAKAMLRRGDQQHHVAAYFGINSGRIAEINTGQTFGHVTPDTGPLPPPGPYPAIKSAIRARDTLLALRDLINEALEDIAEIEAEKGRNAR